MSKFGRERERELMRGRGRRRANVTRSYLHVFGRAAAELISRFRVISHFLQPISVWHAPFHLYRQHTWEFPLATMLSWRGFRPPSWKCGVAMVIVMMVVVVEQSQLGNNALHPWVLIGVPHQQRRGQLPWQWGRRCWRRWPAKAGPFRRSALVEIFVRRSALADFKDVGGLCTRFGRWHEGTSYLSDVLSGDIKSLGALLSPNLPPVLVGFTNQLVAFALPYGDEFVFRLVLIIELHLDIYLPRGDGQITTAIPFRHGSICPCVIQKTDCEWIHISLSCCVR